MNRAEQSFFKFNEDTSEDKIYLTDRGFKPHPKSLSILRQAQERGALEP